MFGKAIHSLSKIGDEIYFEALSDAVSIFLLNIEGQFINMNLNIIFQLALRTVNSSRSAYACFNFAKSFFMQFNKGNNGQFADGDSPALKCKVGVKVCCVFNVFALSAFL